MQHNVLRRKVFHAWKRPHRTWMKWVGLLVAWYLFQGSFMGAGEPQRKDEAVELPVGPSGLVNTKLVVQIMTHKRPEQLRESVAKMSLIEEIAYIVVIWNDVEVLPEAYGLPEFFKELTKPVKLVRSTSNLVTNRWIYHGQGQAVVLNLDDDVYIDAKSLKLGLEMWRLFPNHVVGFARRMIYWDQDIGHWQYDRGGSHPLPEAADYYTMFIGKAWMAGSHLLLPSHQDDPMFQSFVDFLHNPVKDRKGCDDIAFNMFIHSKINTSVVLFRGLTLHGTHAYAGKSTSYAVSSDSSRTEWRFYRDSCIEELLDLLKIDRPLLPASGVLQLNLAPIVQLLENGQLDDNKMALTSMDPFLSNTVT
mmetsp:Transcript_6946/g.42432  ORF Transcript_6946/g.42432 Transcript_6946/m.42432 type:complete len:362 (-) Transcript_6946:2623-3708(-)